MSSFCEDPSRIEAFRSIAQRAVPGDQLNITVLEWTRGHAVGQREHLALVSDLAKRPECQLRIIFAPLDVPQAESANGHLALYERFAVPTAFLSGRLQSVSKSFGGRRDEHGTGTSWFHFLAKNLTVQRLDNRLRIVDPYPSSHPLHRSQVSYNWIKSGYFLSSGSAGNAGVTLVCFGASQALVQRFERLLPHPAWEDSFNLVNQQDSRTMQQDSGSMKTIAAMTLIFLPGTLIASLFSSNFFNFSVGSDGQSEVRLSSYFWVFWIVAVPLTVLTVVLWRLYQFSTREKLKNRPVRWRNFL
ncbi:hypothetical protein B0A49_08339 [Cryomyces minteri]|uniref:Uncharacterized protein n=1 Tax=Cryomyces minteri TaxID=331657 RepID=A0A4U0WGH1_9PEZI|nr:hypothetical protein B0A49_08339 [Cryomyces minteri]